MGGRKKFNFGENENEKVDIYFTSQELNEELFGDENNDFYDSEQDNEDLFESRKKSKKHGEKFKNKRDFS